MKISACVITKNEEKNISTCIKSYETVVDEVIVVDTGSEDSTVKVAQGLGAKVYYYKWEDDFAKARNFALSVASGDWIIFLDADEYFTTKTIQVLQNVLRKAEEIQANMIMGHLTNYDTENDIVLNSLKSIRIFKNSPDIKYKGAIHETIYHKKGYGKKLEATELIQIIHTGYTSNDRYEKQKGERNLQILLKEYNENPNSSDLCFYIAEALMMDNKFSEALEYAYKVFECNNATLQGIQEKNYLNIIGIMLTLQFPKQEIYFTVKDAILLHPTFPDFHFRLGEFLRQDHRIEDAIESYERGISNIDNALSSQSRAIYSINEVLNNLAELYSENNQINKAVEYYTKLLKMDENNYTSLSELIRIFSIKESHMNIFSFLKKMYDYEDINSLVLLLKASLKAQNTCLAELYYELLDKDDREKLTKEKATINIYKGEFSLAYDSYFSLYTKTYKKEFALKALVASCGNNDINQIKSLFPLTGPSLKRLALNLIEMESESILEVDKETLLEFIKELIKVNCLEKSNIQSMIKKYKLEKETAEIFFNYEHYKKALDYYELYLSKNLNVRVYTLVSVLLNISNCLIMLNKYEQAFYYIEEILKIKPSEYRAHSMKISILEKLNDIEKLKKAIIIGGSHFPDSSFIKHKSNLYNIKGVGS